jgi:hypothetical protein
MKIHYLTVAIILTYQRSTKVHLSVCVIGMNKGDHEKILSALSLLGSMPDPEVCLVLHIQPIPCGSVSSLSQLM